MKIYLVGGAVRDELLGLPIKEKDYVVVGATGEEMLKAGFRQVGKDFPVFLHPETHEEYALARMERKVSPGYTGFSFDTSPHVTLEEDLLRRDLTINAMAMSLDSRQLFDPFHGKDDLDKKILRHVSPAFVEDPVRILRVARFAARFASLGFLVSADTNELMQRMVVAHEIDALVPERVWKELERALAEPHPEVFFEVLRLCDALPVLFPEIKTENCLALQQSASLTDDPEIRFAVLLSNLPTDEVHELTDRLRVPGTYKELALMVSKFYSTYPSVYAGNAEVILELLQSVDAFRREARFMKFLQANEILYPDLARATQKLISVLREIKKIDIKPLLEMKLTGDELAKKIRALRIDVITQLR